MRTGVKPIQHRRITAASAPWWVAGVVFPALLAPARAEDPIDKDLSQLSLAELLDVPVTVVSRTASPLGQTAGAVHVITQDDLRRSGAQNIAEALRLAPGMEVAQVNSVNWAVSSAGFNDPYANKLLVLRDGRSIYTPLFSGTYWYQQFVLMADIDRIEVVLGPGASVWGANAVNGVVNVVSKSAFDTTGTLVQAGGGTETLGRFSARTGALIGEDLALRVYAQQEFIDDSQTPGGDRSFDAFDSTMGGFRLDWRNGEAADFMLNGEVYRLRGEGSIASPSPTPPYSFIRQDRETAVGGFLLGRWQRHFSDTSTFSIEGYYDGIRIRHLDLEGDRDTGEIGLQQVMELGERHRLSAGLNYRISADLYRPSGFTVLDPDSKLIHLPSAFVQDEIALVPDRLTLTLGLKAEASQGRDLELQPGVRLAWTPAKPVTVWGSVARAARTPSRAELDATAQFGVFPAGTLDPALPVAVRAMGNPDTGSEHLVALEAGARWQARENLSFDIAGHCHLYDDLRTIDPMAIYLDPSGAFLVLPQTVANNMHGVTWSGEAGLQWNPTPNSRLRASYSFFTPDLVRDADFPGSTDIAFAVGRSPRHQAMIWGSLDLTRAVEIDARLRYVGELTTGAVPSYWELDARLGWKIRSDLEVALIGKGLLHPAHAELGASEYGSAPIATIERSVFAQLTWRF